MQEAANLQQLEDTLGVSFRDKELLVLALRYVPPQNARHSHEPNRQEKLEILGDSVVNLIIIEGLLEFFKGASRGDIAIARDQLASNRLLALTAERLRIPESIQLHSTQWSRLNSGLVSAKTLEALVAGLYQDSGIRVASDFLHRVHIQPHLPTLELGKMAARDKLANWVRRERRPQVRYVLDRSPTTRTGFAVTAFSGTSALGKGFGSTVKEAEMRAAEDAVSKIDFPRGAISRRR